MAPTEGKSRDTSAPRSPPVARARNSPCTSSNSAPIALRPSRCMSMGRDPKSSPPGRATLASPHRASSAPRTRIEARIRRTRSIGASGTSSVGNIYLHTRTREAARGANVLDHAAHQGDIGDVGDVVEAITPRSHQCGDEVLEDRVLGPEHRYFTAQRKPSGHDELMHVTIVRKARSSAAPAPAHYPAHRAHRHRGRSRRVSAEGATCPRDGCGRTRRHRSRHPQRGSGRLSRLRRRGGQGRGFREGRSRHHRLRFRGQAPPWPRTKSSA